MRFVVLALLLGACGSRHHGVTSQTAPNNATTAPPRPAVAAPPPFPALRTGELATATPLVTQGVHTIDNCEIEQRGGGELVERQLRFRCGAARANAMASGGGNVMITLFSQQGIEPAIVIGSNGDARLEKQTQFGAALRFANNAFHAGVQLPPGAPPPPPGMTIYPGDAASVFSWTYNPGSELMRGVVDHGAWKWTRAFAERFPPTGAYLYWPVFLAHPNAEPTIVYLTDPRQKLEIKVRLDRGKTVELPTWGTGSPSDYRIDKIVAIDLKGQTLPVIAAKVDDSIIVAYPEGETYAMRALVGAPQFEVLPPPTTNAAPVASPTGPHCSELESERDREEVYDPELFEYKGIAVAFLSTRVHERQRWTLVPVAGKTPDDDRVGCDWIVDRIDQTTELVVMRLDATSATEVARVPVAYRGGQGAHGSTLLIERAGDVLHAVATSYGIATYSRIRLH